MRSLKKGKLPDILKKKAATWTTDLLAVLQKGKKPSESMKGRYRHKDIKDALMLETLEKCAYCESKFRHITHGDIEHIIPKSKKPSKAYEWDNLTLACDICNENKGDYYSDDPVKTQENLIDPYKDNPSDHLLFMREIVTPRPDSMKGLATESVIKLTRGSLLERRRERMTFLDGLVRAYSLAAPEHKSLLLQDIYDQHLKDSDEYYAISLAYIGHLKANGVIV